MSLKIAGVLIALILASAGLALSEDQITEPQAGAAATPQEYSGSDTQWVWGEVTSVDAPGKTLTLKYLDYETDQEKELTLLVDDLVTYDNVKSLEEIRPKDNLSIDYISKDGKNIAQSISLETSESAPAGDAATTQPETTAAQGNTASAGNNPDTAGQPNPAN